MQKLLAASAPAAPPTAPSLPLSFVADLPLPGNPSRFDHQWVDAAHRRLFIAHLGDSSLLVFDLVYAASETGMVAAFAVAADRTVTEMGRGFLGPNAHTVAVDPATHRVYFPLENVGGRPVLRVMDARVATGSPGSSSLAMRDLQDPTGARIGDIHRAVRACDHAARARCGGNRRDVSDPASVVDASDRERP